MSANISTLIPTGGTYYTAMDGNDSNPGTESHPWRTITKAANTAGMGDTIYIKEGTYNEKIIIKNSGSPGKNITFSAYPGHTVTIDGIGISVPEWNGLIEIRGKSYIKISGFRIVNSEWAGILTSEDYYGKSSSYISIEKNFIYNTYSSGILMQMGNNYIVDGNEIVLGNNAPSNAKVEEIISIQNNVDTFEVRNNYIHNGGRPQYGGEGIDAKWNVSNGKIYNNYLHDLQSVGIYVDSWIGPLYWGDNNARGYVYDIDVFNNRVCNVSTGIAVSAETGGNVDRINIYNNIVYKNKLNGIMVPAYGDDNSPPGLIKNINIINNIAYNNSEGGIAVGYWKTSVDNIVINNNIFSQNQQFQIMIKSASNIQNISVDYNIIDGYRNFSKDNFHEIRGSNYIETDTQFVDATNSDFHLQSTSKAIDQGLSTNAFPIDFDGNTRPKGNGYDIGAYEYDGYVGNNSLVIGLAPSPSINLL